MMRLWLLGRVAILAVAAGAFMSANPGAVMAQVLLTEDEARMTVERQFGVEVLRIDATVDDGKPAFRIRVMNPQGDYNEAFQVSTIMLDRESGKLISQFRQLPAGYDLAGPSTRDVDENAGPALRQNSLR